MLVDPIGGMDRSVVPEGAAIRLAECETVRGMILSWIGRDGEERIDQVRLLREQNQRLIGLVEDLASWLTSIGHPSKATWVRGQLRSTAHQVSEGPLPALNYRRIQPGELSGDPDPR